MSRKMSDDELHAHIMLSTSFITNYFAEMEAGLPDDKKRAQLLGYWLIDYIGFLRKEVDFDPTKLVRYKRGSIVKAHLGYRIGSEEGGLHYGIVLDVNNNKSDQNVTIIPLTSVKPHTDVEHLHRSKLFLGDEVYQSLSDKKNKSMHEAQSIVDSLTVEIARYTENAPEEDTPEYKKWQVEARAWLTSARHRLEIFNEKIENLKRLESQLNKMKRGSIALVGQITTISKLRIYDPLFPSDVLNSVRLSNESLDKIDNKIKELYTHTK